MSLPNNQHSLSVVLATRNEAQNLAHCLDSVKKISSEIVISDETSVDDTVKIAKKYGARIISVPHHSNFHITKNIAIDAARGDWILQLDADEVVTPQLAQEIIHTISQPNHPLGYHGFWINRKNYFLGRFLTKGGQYPDPTLRLYRRGFGRLPAQDVHEQAVVKGPVGHLKHDLLHYRDLSFEKYLDGFNRYSSFIAGQLMQNRTPINLINSINYMILKPLYTFILIYLRHRGYVDGFPGFVFAIFSGLIHPISFLKYWQIKNYPS